MSKTKDISKLRKKARAIRARADKLWRDAPQVRLDRFKRPYFNKVKKLYEEANRLDKRADKLAKK